jgi:hypothetical protein
VRRAGALVLVVVLAVAACGGDDDGDEGAARTTTTDTATPAGTRSTEPVAAPAPGVPAAGTATCMDESADTEEFTPGADLLGVDLTAAGGGLKVLFRLVGPVPTAGRTMWSVWARPRGGENIQFVALLDGDTRSAFVYHYGDGIQQDLPPEAMVVGADTIEVTYPTAAVGALRTPFDWRAESTVEVDDVDYCPGGSGTTVLDDARLPFTG